jgi:hypothetical protein
LSSLNHLTVPVAMLALLPSELRTREKPDGDDCGR